jgi:hypothetical protein
MYSVTHGASGLPFTATASPGGASAPGSLCGAGGQDPRRSGRHPGRPTPSGGPMGQAVSGGRGGGPQGSEAGASLRRKAVALAGRHGGAAHHGPLPRSTPDALFPLDAGGGAESDGPAIRGSAVGLDSGALPPALGLHPTEAHPESLRAGPGGGAPLAHEAVSGDPGAGPTGASDDLLGRRDRHALGSSSGTVLGPAGPDPCGSRDRQAISLQHDLGSDQPGKARLHGLFGSFHADRVLVLSAAAGAPHPADTFPHPRFASGARGRPHQAMGEASSAADAPVFPSRLFPGAQPRRAVQPGCQDQRGGAKAAAHGARVGRQRAPVPLQHPAQASKGSPLLQTSQRPLRRVNATYLLLPVIIFPLNRT